VFGSMARGDGGEESDLDLLYELAPGAALGWEIEELEAGLAELFGRPVDLVSKGSRHRRLRAAGLAAARELYAA
jgi:predicted nucleotidyltransferase